MTALAHRPAHAFALAACIGLAFANALRAGPWLLVLAFGAVAACAFTEKRLVAISVALLLGGWLWGSVRLDALDRSPLAARIGTAERLRVVVTSTPRRGRFDIRAQGNRVQVRVPRMSPAVAQAAGTTGENPQVRKEAEKASGSAVIPCYEDEAGDVARMIREGLAKDRVGLTNEALELLPRLAIHPPPVEHARRPEQTAPA